MSVMWKNKLKRLFSRRLSHLLGIDIGTGSLKIAEISWKKNRPTLKCIGIADLPQNIVADGKITDGDAVTDILKKLLSTCGATCRDAVAALGGQAVFVREMPFPVMSDEELREALKWEAEKYVPYAPETYYHDFSIIGAGQNEQEVKVLLVAAQHSTVNELVQVIKNAGLRPAAIDIEPLALYRTLAGSANSMVVDIGRNISQVIVFQNGSPAVTRNLPLGGQRFTEVIMSVLSLDGSEAERLKHRQNNLLQKPDHQGEASALHLQLQLLVDELARELRRTTDYYQMQHRDAIVENIFLTGGGAIMNNLAGNLAAQLDLPVTVHDPLTMLDVAPSFDKQYLSGIAPQLSVAVGLGLRGGDMP